MNNQQPNELEDDPFERLLKDNNVILEVLGIFSAVAVLFSSDLVQKSPFLQYVSFGSLLMILLLSSLFIRKLVKNLPKIGVTIKEKNSGKMAYFKKSFKFFPYFISITALLLIDFGILLYIFSQPDQSNLLINTIGVICLIIFYFAELFLPLNDLVQTHKTKRILALAVGINLVMVFIILGQLWISSLNALIIDSICIAILLIGTVVLICQWRKPL